LHGGRWQHLAAELPDRAARRGQLGLRLTRFGQGLGAELGGLVATRDAMTFVCW
jgi:hypothetical protein